MFDVAVEVVQKVVEGGKEGGGGGGEGLEGVKIFFDLFCWFKRLVCGIRVGWIGVVWMMDVTYGLMLGAIDVGEVGAFLTEMLFHGWVHGQFFADGVAGQGPGELVPPLGFLF
jgi:uncharacterized membrane protein YeaQ/YmgE (transglycosylase-associated protein family)